MDWYWWVAIAVVLGYLVVLPLYRNTLGKGSYIASMAREYLRHELKKWQISQHIPNGCVAEIAEPSSTFATQYAEMQGSGLTGAQGAMKERLERDARVILEWTRGRDIAGDRINYIPEALKKYGVPLGVGNKA